jgi:oligoribonuclease NrnB/cAMP/cGMP phosphodiesterase (DHH superfamily)
MSAYSAWLKLRDRTDLVFIGANYNEPFPVQDTDILDSDIYIMDFSFPKETLQKVHNLAKSLLILDHHKTAKEQLSDLPFAVFNLNKSGAMLAWEHFHPTVSAPKLIQYVQDRDLWKWKLPHSREINAVIQSYNIGAVSDFKTFEKLSEQLEDKKMFQQFVFEGAAILRAIDQFTDLAIKRSFRMIEIKGYKIPVVNTSIFESETCLKLLKLCPEAPFSATYYDLKTTNEKAWSLRSLPGIFDVTTSALQFGGGGHENASGFKTKNNEII